jgi:hypothetical protein
MTTPFFCGRQVSGALSAQSTFRCATPLICMILCLSLLQVCGGISSSVPDIPGSNGKIAFTYIGSQSEEISLIADLYRTNLDGTEQKQLTNTPSREESPT